VDQLLKSDAQRKGFIRGKATQMKGFIRRKVADQLFQCSCVLDTTHPIPNPMKPYENNSNPKGSTSKKPPNLPFMNKHHGSDPNSQQLKTLGILMDPKHSPSFYIFSTCLPLDLLYAGVTNKESK
jgi:hypothetical protein